MIKPYAGMKLYEDTSFFPGVYNFFGNEGIEVCADDITIEGNGSVFIGGIEKRIQKDEQIAQEFSYGYDAMVDTGLGFYGMGIHIRNRKNVTIQGMQVRGFMYGLYMENCEFCSIVNNDFSYNYHNPSWGWDEHIDAGGMILLDCHENTICNNTATNVWSALVLRNSNHNTIVHNTCSHTSNVGLRCWLASNNVIEDNDFSWGIRKEANEVHARDSSCVLIESGSCHNIFRRNDMRYGGDGLFIRSLNNMMSMHNVFEDNDASFANNNAIEAWDSYNTYIRNKANYSSYGFWLGCSDHTILIENEVIGNGVSFQNAPESFGNAGIAVVNGSGNDFLLERNIITDNQGPGIAIRNTIEVPSRNWMIKNNCIRNNKDDVRGFKGYGIYCKNALNLHIMQNDIQNDSDDIYQDENVRKLVQYDKDTELKKVSLKQTIQSPTCGEWVSFEASGDFAQYAYYFDDDFMSNQRVCERIFSKPGRYRMFLNAYSEHALATYNQNMYVLPVGSVITEVTQPSCWLAKGKGQQILSTLGLDDRAICLQAKHSTHASFTCSVDALSMHDASHIAFYYCYQNDFIDWKEEIRLCVTLRDACGGYMKLTSNKAAFVRACQRANEAKYEWEYCQIPLEESADYTCEISDDFNGVLSFITFTFDTPIASFMSFSLDKMTLLQETMPTYHSVLRGNEVQPNKIKQHIEFSSLQGEEAYAIFGPNRYQYEGTKRWISTSDQDVETITISLVAPLPIDKIDIKFYVDQDIFHLPEEVLLVRASGDVIATSADIVENHLSLHCEGMLEQSFSIHFKKKPHTKLSIYHCECFYQQHQDVRLRCQETSYVQLQAALVKLHIETWPKTQTLPNLIYELYGLECGDIRKADLLFHNEIESDQVQHGKETWLAFHDVKVKKGRMYALMLSTTSLAIDVQNGAYYRWVGDGIRELDGTYGYWNHDGIVDKGKTGWGDCYVKLSYHEHIVDHSTQHEGLGNRFGLPSMEKLYQTFKIPEDSLQIRNPNYLFDEGLHIHDTMVIRMYFDQPGRKIRMYLKKDTLVSAYCNCQHFENKHTILEVESMDDGWQEVSFVTQGNEILFIE